MRDDSDCACPAGYYDEGLTACTQCQTGCAECDGLNECTVCLNESERTGSQCECPSGYEDNEDGVSCDIITVVEEGILIPSESYDGVPTV